MTEKNAFVVDVKKLPLGLLWTFVGLELAHSFVSPKA